MSLRFFEEAIISGHQIIAACGFGSSDVEGVEADDPEILDV